MAKNQKIEDDFKDDLPPAPEEFIEDVVVDVAPDAAAMALIEEGAARSLAHARFILAAGASK